MKGKMSVVGFAVLACSLSACASYTGRPTTEVTVTTPQTVWAECVLTNKEGSQTIHSPETALVGRSRSDLHIACTKTGFEPAEVKVPSQLEPRLILNALCGVPAPLCLATDFATGAAYNYPRSVQVPLVAVPDITADAVAHEP